MKWQNGNALHVEELGNLVEDHQIQLVENVQTHQAEIICGLRQVKIHMIYLKYGKILNTTPYLYGIKDCSHGKIIFESSSFEEVKRKVRNLIKENRLYHNYNITSGIIVKHFYQFFNLLEDIYLYPLLLYSIKTASKIRK